MFLQFIVAVLAWLSVMPVSLAEEQARLPLKISIQGEVLTKGLKSVAKHYTDFTKQEVEVFDRNSRGQRGNVDIRIWAHDKIGTWVEGADILAIKPSENLRNNISDFAWQAVTYKNKVWAYPLGFETYSLVYNKRLISESPTSFQEISDKRQTNWAHIETILGFEYTNFYYVYPFINRFGGFLFGGTYRDPDRSVIGIDAGKGFEGLDFIQQLLSDDLLGKEHRYEKIMDNFIQGNTAMVITGPWEWRRFMEAGLNIGIAPIPRIQNESPRPFVGVKAVYISAGSSQPDAAKYFIENYLLNEAYLTEFYESGIFGIPTHQQVLPKIVRNPTERDLMVPLYAEIEKGIVMPSIPEMAYIWQHTPNALQAFKRGRASASKVLEIVAKKVRSSIGSMNAPGEND